VESFRSAGSSPSVRHGYDLLLFAMSHKNKCAINEQSIVRRGVSILVIVDLTDRINGRWLATRGWMRERTAGRGGNGVYGLLNGSGHDCGCSSV
jgi:hypothetical protein